jgi:ribosomal protein L7/L12
MVDDMQFAKVTARVALLERQVEFLLTQLKMDYTDIPPVLPYPDVAELKRNGNMIEAIKLYRSKTGAGLAEAKLFIENMDI